MIRATEDKLERHEFRERALGEHVKKAFLMLDKRLKSLDPVKGTVSRLDERLAAVETILMQKDERERAQLVKTHEAVVEIQQNLPSVMDKMKAEIIEQVTKSACHQTQSDAGTNVANTALDKVHKELAGRLDNMSTELTRVLNDSRRIGDSSTDSLERVKKQLTNSEQLLQKYESKLAELNNRIPPLRSDKDERVERDWQTTVLTELEAQRNGVEELSGEIKKLNTNMELLATKDDVGANTNATIDALGQVCNDSSQLRSDDAIANLTMGQDALALLTRDQYKELRAEIAGLAKVEQVMVQTADSVLDIKRRVEYGVHQVLLEVGGLVKAQAKSLNATIHDRFDTFETVVLDGDSGALANLTAKIGAEIDQVWRQIGIMHQQMGASTDTLDRLRNQTDLYVSGSLAAMDGVQGKVGQITTRMSDLDENLNYLMGKLSLVTQQFNQIKSGLGRALDEMRASLATVKDKMPAQGEEPPVDQGPGPHNIKPESTEDALLNGNSLDVESNAVEDVHPQR